jgi:hypothetical protein
VVIVQKLRQLLAQAFVALAFVSEPDGAFEQLLLDFLRKLAPERDRGFPQDAYEALGIVVYGHGTLPARDKRGVEARVPIYPFARVSTSRAPLSSPRISIVTDVMAAREGRATSRASPARNHSQV